MFTLLFSMSSILTFQQQPNIQLEVVGNSNDSKHWAFFAPHENEHVSNDYVAQKIIEKGGVFVVLKQAGKRTVTLEIDNHKIKIDPNRMFTQTGRFASINKLNPELASDPLSIQKAEQRAKKLSEFVLDTLSGKQPPKTLIAMHNNSNGYEGDGKQGIGNVSIERYQTKLSSGAQYLIDVASGQHDEDDLYFVTDKHDFSTMQSLGWNAVLQNPKVAHDPEEDDGSLSVYAEMQGYRYINIEAERVTEGFGENHLAVQKQMVDFTFSLLEQNTAN
ncbi:hypothetical protein L0668_06830 [Paraglaciecola aquimarina]|uniref:N-acetylmuramoyl-L-alanine amidase n=1 Tax=Paraglaciecola algarum TaxID=3050085 RepID=A0ABS9D703_9ALTE|nr:hypothetical protein [Paraglaciecola sp. G1-23]MCF2947813.1 hypothetical protein [Paraglaciecola sp. G1-23]